MTKKELAIKIVRHLGFGGWKYEHESGPGSRAHFFVNEPGGQHVLVLGSSINVQMSLSVLRPHHCLLVESDNPQGHVRKNVERLRGLEQELNPEQIERLVTAGSVARKFFEKFTSVEAVNAEIDSLLADEPDLERALYDKIRSFVPQNFMVLAIKYEAKDPNFEDFLANVKELDWVNKNGQCKYWVEVYESGELEQRLDEFRTESPGTEHPPVLMKDHPVHVRSAVCGFVCERKMAPKEFGEAFDTAYQKVGEVELTESVVDFRDGFDPWDIDVFDFGSGMLCITSNEAVSDLNFERASVDNRIITFRAIEPSAMWSIELFSEGKSVSMRVDHNGQTLKEGSDLLPNCNAGSMDLFAIFKSIESEFGTDFWQLPQELDGVRLSIT